MTNEEFFEKVKGKKICQKSWGFDSGYFIPDYLWGSYMYGSTSVLGFNTNYDIGDQFNKWEFYEEDKPVENTCKDCVYYQMPVPSKAEQGYEMYCSKRSTYFGNLDTCEAFTSKISDTFWMVFVSGSKIPQCKHDTYESAKEEAERLAKKSGAEVALIECVSIKKCKAVKKVEWEEI